MGNRTRRVAFIPVRGGSKSIPKKNIKGISGKPLVYWVIDAALKSEVFDGIYISTDDTEIKEVVSKHSSADLLTVVSRSEETATDSATTESAMIEFAQNHEFDEIVLIQATSPLLKSVHLKKACSDFTVNKEADSLLSVCRQERFIWHETDNGFVEPINYDPVNRPRRQDFDGFLVENGAFYITSRKALLETGSRLSGNILFYEMPPETYFELDEPTDWVIIEKLLNKHKKESSFQNFKEVKLFISDVDGVLTDAGMYYSENGDELKKFNTHDGMAFELLRNVGIKTGIITSENTELVNRRAGKLKLDFLYQGKKGKNKLSAVKEICQKLNISLDEVAYIGDDVNCFELLTNIGYPACPKDAIGTIKNIPNIRIMNKKGGEGCVREYVEYIIDSQNK